jgi:hypothetical protein
MDGLRLIMSFLFDRSDWLHASRTCISWSVAASSCIPRSDAIPFERYMEAHDRAPTPTTLLRHVSGLRITDITPMVMQSASLPRIRSVTFGQAISVGFRCMRSVLDRFPSLTELSCRTMEDDAIGMLPLIAGLRILTVDIDLLCTGSQLACALSQCTRMETLRLPRNRLTARSWEWMLSGLNHVRTLDLGCVIESREFLRRHISLPHLRALTLRLDSCSETIASAAGPSLAEHLEQHTPALEYLELHLGLDVTASTADRESLPTFFQSLDSIDLLSQLREIVVGSSVDWDDSNDSRDNEKVVCYRWRADGTLENPAMSIQAHFDGKFRTLSRTPPQGPTPTALPPPPPSSPAVSPPGATSAPPSIVSSSTIFLDGLRLIFTYLQDAPTFFAASSVSRDWSTAARTCPSRNEAITLNRVSKIPSACESTLFRRHLTQLLIPQNDYALFGYLDAVRISLAHIRTLKLLQYTTTRLDDVEMIVKRLPSLTSLHVHEIADVALLALAPAAMVDLQAGRRHLLKRFEFVSIRYSKRGLEASAECSQQLIGWFRHLEALCLSPYDRVFHVEPHWEKLFQPGCKLQHLTIRNSAEADTFLLYLSSLDENEADALHQLRSLDLVWSTEMDLERMVATLGRLQATLTSLSIRVSFHDSRSKLTDAVAS